jgi:hypothetical protein
VEGAALSAKSCLAARFFTCSVNAAPGTHGVNASFTSDVYLQNGQGLRTFVVGDLIMDIWFQRRALACGLLLLAAGSATAATQGSAGSTSTGSISIGASVPNRVQLSGLTDVAFTNQDPTVAATKAQNVCVWSNSSTRGYNVTASGSGASSAFTLANATLTVPYTVEWAGTSGAPSGTGLSAGAALTGLTSTATNPSCSPGPASSASLIVKIAAADLQSMQAATNYTGTLTLVVAPE